MNVIQAFDTQKNALPDMIVVRTERTEDFSDYVREAIERARNEEPETRSAASPEQDETQDHDDRHAHEAKRDHEPHAASDRRRHDEAAEDIAEDDAPITKIDDGQASTEDKAEAEPEDKADATESKTETATNADEDATAAPADGKTAPAAPAAPATTAGEPASKKTKMADAGTMIGHKETGGNKGADKAASNGNEVRPGATAATQANPAADTGNQAAPQTPAKAAANKAAATPQAAAQAKTHAAANSAVQMSETAAAQQPVADAAAIDPKQARGKDPAPGQAIATAKKSEMTTAKAFKPDTGGDSTSSDGKTSGQSASGQTATAAMAAQTVKTPTPAFTGMLPNGGEIPGQGGPAGDPAHVTGLTQAGTTAEQASAAIKAAAQKTAPSGHTPAGDQVAIRIASAVRQGVDRISIQLEPQDLGRVDVKLELSGDGRVAATVSADRQDTLDLLQRDSRALERALQQAGLKADSDSLNFNLRGNNGQDQQQANGTAGASGGNPDMAVADDDPLADPAQYRPINTNSALDIRV